MSNQLKLKVKKTKLFQKLNGVKTLGYYGRVISNGKKTYEQVALESCVNTTVHKAEMKVAAELLLDGIATNRKLGSDMADGVTGGGLHGKDLSKADVSVNIYCHLLAQQKGKVVTACCAIGDETVNILVGNEPRRIPYADIVSAARDYIRSVGGFERFAEWGLV